MHEEFIEISSKQQNINLIFCKSNCIFASESVTHLLPAQSADINKQKGEVNKHSNFAIN